MLDPCSQVYLRLCDNKLIIYKPSECDHNSRKDEEGDRQGFDSGKSKNIFLQYYVHTS